MGAFIDHVEALDANGRRQLLNETRAELGLESIEYVEGHEAFVRANREAILSRGAPPRFTVDFATMREIPVGEHAVELIAKEQREIQILHERDERKREEAEQRRRAQEASDVAFAKLAPPGLGPKPE